MLGQAESAGHRQAGHRSEQTPRTLILGGSCIAVGDTVDA